MLPVGAWTSKLGKGEDIEHETFQVVEGKQYGTAQAFLKSPNSLCQKTKPAKDVVLSPNLTATGND
jgi:hypothetical protein